MKKAEDQMYKNKLIEAKNVQHYMINFLTKTLFDKGIETEEHSERVVKLSKKFAERLKLSNKNLEALLLYAKLHNIGKITLDKKILKKKGKLKQEELAEFKKHIESGYRIASSSVLLNQISEYILSHHEQLDGNGYPRGLKKEKIPLISRIFAIVEAYDELIYGNFNIKPVSKQKAIEELKNLSGVKFDPNLVKIFLEIIQ